MDAAHVQAGPPLDFADDLYPLPVKSPLSDSRSDHSFVSVIGYTLRHIFTEPEDGLSNVFGAAQLPGPEASPADEPMVEEIPPSACIPELDESVLVGTAGIDVHDLSDHGGVGLDPVAAALAVQRNEGTIPALAHRFGFNIGAMGADPAEALRRLVHCPLGGDITYPIYMQCDNGH